MPNVKDRSTNEMIVQITLSLIEGCDITKASLGDAVIGRRSPSAGSFICAPMIHFRHATKTLAGASPWASGTATDPRIAALLMYLWRDQFLSDVCLAELMTDVSDVALQE
jgi:hypothetical protein